MIFWILLSVFFLVALAMVLIPLFRYRNERNTDAPHKTKSIDVYKAQLLELEADQRNGVLGEAEVTSARLEIERRLLKAAGHQDSEDHASREGASRPFLALVTTIVFLVSMAFYLMTGMPGMPDFALKDQKHSVARQTQSTTETQDMLREVAGIETHLTENPTDIKAWRTLGQYHSKLHNPAEAARAFQRWYDLEPDNIEAAVVYAESLIIFSNGRVSPAASLVLKRAQEIQPDHPGVRHYQALAQYQAGNVEQALAGWKSLEADTRPGALWLRPLRRWIRQAETDLGLQTAGSVAVAPALSAENRQAIGNMSGKEQAAMIKSMVARLQGKMDKNPDDIEGWLRLAKAYMVLGQKQDVIKSLEQALKHAPDDLKAPIKKQLDILLKQE